MSPVFPIRVTFYETGEVVSYQDMFDLITGLEWFDSSDSNENAIVMDSCSRKVDLKIESMRLVKFEIAS